MIEVLILLGEIGLGLLVVVLITALTGYFVAQEFAYMAADRSRLAAAAADGDVGAGRALTITRRTSFMLSGAQLGITVTGLLVGYVAEPLIGASLGELLGGAGVGTGLGLAIGTVVAVVVSTGIQMVFGELFPKNLAIARPEPVAGWLARSTRLYLAAFGWLIWLFDQSSNLLLKALGIAPVHDVEHAATPRDLAHIVAASRVSGDLDADSSALLDRIIDFPTRTAEHAMTPRTRVSTITATEDLTQVRARMAGGHTRYPVVGADVDDVRGVVSLHDVLDDELCGRVADHMRPAVAVPASLSLPDVLARMDSAPTQMVIVIDEYGGFAGVVTREDVAEELLGGVSDEHDDLPATVRPHVEGGWTVPGDLSIDEAERIIGHRLPPGPHETLAGAIVAAAQRFPTPGERIDLPLAVDPTDFAHADAPAGRVLSALVCGVQRRVPSSVHLTVHDNASPAVGSAAPERTDR